MKMIAKRKNSVTYLNSVLLKKCCLVEVMLFSTIPGIEYCQTSFFTFTANLRPKTSIC